MATLKRKLISNLRNIQSGTKVKDRIVVFDSDDWGSNRIASKEDLDALIKSGLLSSDPCVYDRCDTIARKDDLSSLFEVLSKYRDRDGNHAVVSAFFNPVNPDFQKIKESGYQEYYYETFLDTLEKTGEKEEVYNLWKQGIENKVIFPEYHGREHLTVPLWMKYLQKGDKRLLKAFEYHFCTINVAGVQDVASGFRPTLYFEDYEQKKWLEQSLSDGVDIMKQIFGFIPITFAPSNGVSHPDFDRILSANGFTGLHNPHRFEPDGLGSGVNVNCEKINKFGQIHYNRNCVFEPVQHSYDTVDFCLAQIQAAFNWHKAAIISTHRVNYMGGIDPNNRSKGLSELNRLLSSIVKKWSDVRFLTTDEYIRLIKHEQ